MRTIHKNVKEDFKLLVDLGAGYDGEDFDLVFTAGRNTADRYVCSYKNGTYKNCVAVTGEDTSILCLFDGHGLPVGPLNVEINRYVTDTQMPDGVMRLTDNRLLVCTDSEGDYVIELTRGQSDNPELTAATLLLLADVIKGDKGEGINDAPQDGKTYGVKNGEWTEVSGGIGVVDTSMSDESENAVQNKVIKAYIDNTEIRYFDFDIETAEVGDEIDPAPIYLTDDVILEYRDYSVTKRTGVVANYRVFFGNDIYVNSLFSADQYVVTEKYNASDAPEDITKLFDATRSELATKQDALTHYTETTSEATINAGSIVLESDVTSITSNEADIYIGNGVEKDETDFKGVAVSEGNVYLGGSYVYVVNDKGSNAVALAKDVTDKVINGDNDGDIRITSKTGNVMIEDADSTGISIGSTSIQLYAAGSHGIDLTTEEEDVSIICGKATYNGQEIATTDITDDLGAKVAELDLEVSDIKDEIGDVETILATING